MRRWIKLTKVDNLGTILYEWNDKRYAKPSHVIVRWPSGKIERCKVVKKSHSETISERHTVCYTLWFVKTDHYGLKVEVPIEKVSVAIERKKIVTEMAGV